MTEIPSLEDKVAFLADPATHGVGAGDVIPIETHWSWVFLTPTHALKFKKPLWRPWIDLTTLEAREANCREELHLNRRLTSGIYEDVVPICVGADGGMALGGEGRPVEWLVRMVRLPASRMLDVLAKKGEVHAEEIAALGQRLVRFYTDQTPRIADGELYVEHLRTETAENRARLVDADVGMASGEVRDIVEQCDRLLEDCLPLVRRRIADGRIVEGHGDLRPEHVCLTEPIQIFDALEFDLGMRVLDPFDEMNYLGLECALLGAGWIRTQLLEVLDSELGEPPQPRLMTFYSVFRATLRARICLAHLDDPGPVETERWLRKARVYLQFTQQELRRLPA